MIKEVNKCYTSRLSNHKNSSSYRDVLRLFDNAFEKNSLSWNSVVARLKKLCEGSIKKYAQTFTSEVVSISLDLEIFEAISKICKKEKKEDIQENIDFLIKKGYVVQKESDGRTTLLNEITSP